MGTVEKAMALLREQFIAVQGHDLRNPLDSITLCAQLLMQSESVEELKMMDSTITRSAGRMTELISNVMDFAITQTG